MARESACTGASIAHGLLREHSMEEGTDREFPEEEQPSITSFFKTKKILSYHIHFIPYFIYLWQIVVDYV